MFEMAHLHEDALREYDELELCYLETGAPFCLSVALFFVQDLYFSFCLINLVLVTYGFFYTSFFLSRDITWSMFRYIYIYCLLYATEWLKKKTCIVFLFLDWESHCYLCYPKCFQVSWFCLITHSIYYSQYNWETEGLRRSRPWWWSGNIA